VSRRRAFSAGRAPAAWLRDLERAVRGISALRRAGAWLPALASVRPRLLERAGWDAGLGDMTARPAGPVREARPARARPAATAASGTLAGGAGGAPGAPRAAAGRAAAGGPPAFAPRPPGPPAGEGGNSARRPFARWSDPVAAVLPAVPSPSDPGGRGPAPRGARPPVARPIAGPLPAEVAGIDPAALPRRADPVFLEALAARAPHRPAGTADAPPRARRPSAGAWSPPAGRGEETLPAPAGVSPGSASPAAPAASEARPDEARWGERVVRGAARRLPAGAEGHASMESTIAAQWDAPLSAPTVTAGWLAALAAPGSGRTGREPSGAPERVPRERGAGERPKAAAPSAESAASVRFAGLAPSAASAALPAAALGAPAEHAAGVREAVLAPPRFPRLAGDTPGAEDGPAAAGWPHPALPGAAGVRLPPAPPEGRAGEDLGELACRIKTILDDEARRFGIDV